MPTFDLRGIKIAKYTNTNGVLSYDTPVPVGDAMSANLELQFAEAKLYAEGSLAEYAKDITGGTISIGVKYIQDTAQMDMFGTTEVTRTVGTKTIKSRKTGKDTQGNYVGIGFFAPDKIDGATKFTAIFIYKALFGEPAMSLETKGDSIKFQTPTTSGMFLTADDAAGSMKEVAVCDTSADAVAWIAQLFSSGGAVE